MFNYNLSLKDIGKNIMSRPLFIFEMANNHSGDVEHGLKIIREIKKVCRDYEYA